MLPAKDCGASETFIGSVNTRRFVGQTWPLKRAKMLEKDQPIRFYLSDGETVDNLRESILQSQSRGVIVTTPERFVTMHISPLSDVHAPDGSEIRILTRHQRASSAHGTLPVGVVSRAICHRTVDEIWYVLSGRAEIWRKLGDYEEVIAADAGTSITIPVGTHFQFRTVGTEPFCFIMFTTPPWSGDDEAVHVVGLWDVGAT